MNSPDQSDATPDKVSKSEPCIDYHPNDRFCIQDNKKAENAEETMKDEDMNSSNSIEEPEINGSDESNTHKPEGVESSEGIQRKELLVNGSNEDSVDSDLQDNDASSDANDDDEMEVSLPRNADTNHKEDSRSSEGSSIGKDSDKKINEEKDTGSPAPETNSAVEEMDTSSPATGPKATDDSLTSEDKTETSSETADPKGNINNSDVCLDQSGESSKKDEAEDTKPASPSKKSSVTETLNRNNADTVKAKSVDNRTENKSLSLIVDKLKNSAAAQGNETQGSTEKAIVVVSKTLNPPGLDNTKVEKVETKPSESEFLSGPDMVSEEILERAKFPAFLKGAIDIGNFLSLPIPCSADFKLRDGEALLESPSLISPLLLKKPDKILVEDTEGSKKTAWDAKPFFNSSAGEFLIGIGLSRAKEWYDRDQVRLKRKQLKKEGKGLIERETELSQAQTTYLRTKQANDPFTFDLKRCDFCDFKTESSTIMEGHLLVPHLTSRREYRCNFCAFTTRDHKAILFHMEALHGKKGVLDLSGPFFYDCPFCMFETNLKTKATSHINKCQKYFLPARNQAPPGDWEHPSVTAKPITRADIKSYEMCVAAATASTTSRGRGVQKGFPAKTIRPRGSYMVSTRPSVPLYQQLATSTLKDSVNYRALTPQAGITRPRYTDMIAHLRSTKPEISVVSGGQIYQVVSNSGQVVPVISSTTLNTPASQLLLSSANQGPQPVALFPNLATGNVSRTATPQGMPRMASTIQNKQLPRLQGPYNTPTTRPSGTNPAAANTSFVICEICDGYLKDLEQLRTHMLWIHKVKIHPKMLASRPPLNCQKCQWRFFTDQGLERHLLGAHGLVTSNMQELSNKNQDGGRCTICGRVYVCKLVSHMNQVHKIALKPAHLSYKCTVCTATFNLYKLFETHVYMFHSGSVKRPAEDSSSDPPKKKFQSAQASEPPKVSRPGPASQTEKKKTRRKRKKD